MVTGTSTSTRSGRPRVRGWCTRGDRVIHSGATCKRTGRRSFRRGPLHVRIASRDKRLTRAFISCWDVLGLILSRLWSPTARSLLPRKPEAYPEPPVAVVEPRRLGRAGPRRGTGTARTETAHRRTPRGTERGDARAGRRRFSPRRSRRTTRRSRHTCLGAPGCSAFRPRPPAPTAACQRAQLRLLSDSPMDRSRPLHREPDGGIRSVRLVPAADRWPVGAHGDECRGLSVTYNYADSNEAAKTPRGRVDALAESSASRGGVSEALELPRGGPRGGSANIVSPTTACGGGRRDRARRRWPCAIPRRVSSSRRTRTGPRR